MLGTNSGDVQNLQLALAKYGYGVPVTGKYDGPTMEVVTAFQHHLRPGRVDGIADHSTLITLHALLTSLPGMGGAVRFPGRRLFDGRSLVSEPENLWRSIAEGAGIAGSY